MLLSVIIPIYNEESNIPLLYKRLKTVMTDLNLNYEFLFINDGSKDNSIYLIRELAIIDSSVRFIDFSRNFGHQIAVSAGLDHCKGDAVVIIDADLQDPPELIGDLIQKYHEGYSVVYARRKSREGETFLKKFTARLFYRLLAKITNVNIPVDTGDFRIIERKVVEVLKQMPEQNKFLRGQIAWVGFRQTYVEYERKERNSGQTGYTYKKMIRLAMDAITSFSDFPLKLATIAGFTVSGIAFLVMLYTLYSRFFTTDYVHGWPSLMVSILFLGGVQLIGIGIIGEYLSRMGNNIRNRPLYIIGDSNINPEKSIIRSSYQQNTSSI
jgi:polyisoprenyl-phosphate glycosyltransferase